MFFFPLITAIVTLCVGVATIVLNPRRPINRVLAAVCFAGVMFFAAQLTAKWEGARYVAEGVGNPLIWIRIKFGIVALISPMLVWLCFYVVSGRYSSRRDLWRKMLPWIAVSMVLAFIPFTEGFKPSDSLPGKERYGPLYPFYFGPMMIGQIVACVAGMVMARKLRGVRRLEFAFIALALGYLSFAAVVVEILFATWPSPTLHTISRVASYAVYLMFCVSAWSVTSYRVYHSQQVMLSLGQRFLLLATVAGLTVWLIGLIRRFEPSGYAEATIVACGMLLFHVLDVKVRGKLKLLNEQRTNQVARRLRAMATRQSDPAALLEQCETTLREFAEADVKILVRDSETYGTGEDALPAEQLGNPKIHDEGWYSLIARSRVAEPGADPLYDALVKRHWTAVVLPEGAEQYPTLIVALGERANSLPFTYPELRVLRELTNVVESIYTRSRLALQVRQGEQLAAIGKLGVSIVHELRNPMWTLKSFSQLLPERTGDTQFLRSFAEIVPQEANRIEALAEQMLDLARPRQYRLQPADLHEIIEQTATLSRPQLAEIGGSLETKLSAGSAVAMVDSDAIRQVLLNLIRNAWQALQRVPQQPEKRITVRTEQRTDLLVIEVADNGPGIPTDIRRKLFSAFASSGKQGGLGIGLVVCREILAVHSGSISAHDRDGGGAIFRLTLPLKPVAEAFEESAAF